MNIQLAGDGVRIPELVERLSKGCTAALQFASHQPGQVCDVLVYVNESIDDRPLKEQLRLLRPIAKTLIFCVGQGIRRDPFLEKDTECISPLDWSCDGISERILGHLYLSLPKAKLAPGQMLGLAPSMQALVKQIGQLARLTDPVLILGETGTGKSLVAQAIHQASSKPGGYFSINTSEFQRELVESELFGHVRGAFTGAQSDREGLLTTHKGTLLLDEIGDLSPNIQTKLLSCVEEKQARPVGSNKYVPIKARLLFATHKNLSEMAERGEFRLDLYNRLSYFELKVPALRERRVDIPILAQHLLDEFNSENNCQLRVPGEAFDELFRYDWPGNVRELRRVIVRASGFSEDGKWINLSVVQECTSGSSPQLKGSGFQFNPNKETWHQVRDRLQEDYFRKLSNSTRSREDVVTRSGLSRAQVFKILGSLGLTESHEHKQQTSES